MAEHPITPPLELVGQWLCSEDYLCAEPTNSTLTITSSRLQNVATQAARWGADQELEACCADIHTLYGPGHADWLRSIRRPKPPSLKDRIAAAITDGDERKALKLLEELDD